MLMTMVIHLAVAFASALNLPTSDQVNPNCDRRQPRSTSLVETVCDGEFSDIMEDLHAFQNPFSDSVAVVAYVGKVIHERQYENYQDFVGEGANTPSDDVSADYMPEAFVKSTFDSSRSIRVVIRCNQRSGEGCEIYVPEDSHILIPASTSVVTQGQPAGNSVPYMQISVGETFQNARHHMEARGKADVLSNGTVIPQHKYQIIVQSGLLDASGNLIYEPDSKGAKIRHGPGITFDQDTHDFIGPKDLRRGKLIGRYGKGNNLQHPEASEHVLVVHATGMFVWGQFTPFNVLWLITGLPLQMEGMSQE